MPYVIDVARKPVTFRKCEERVELFAPSWELVMQGVRHEIPWEKYVELYIEEMRDAYRRDPATFHRFAKMIANVHLSCWCEKKDPRRRINGHCHTYVLRDILEKIKKRLSSPAGTGGDDKSCS